MPVSIRDACLDDAPAMLEIYAPIVEHSHTSFEIEVPSLSEYRQRIESAQRNHAWLVACIDEAVVGYAYGNTHRARKAYEFSVETAVYVRDGYRGRRIGSRVYAALFERLVELGYFHAFAGITMPNEASVALHEAVGFEAIGVFPKIGFKYDQWHDVSWWYRKLQNGKPSGYR